MALLAERVRLLENSSIRRMFDEAARRPDAANLTLGQPDFDALPATRSAALRHLRSAEPASHGAGLLSLRRAVSVKLRERNGIPAKPDTVLITPGVTAGIQLLCLALFQPGDEVLVPDPYFAVYPHALRLAGATSVPVDTYPDFCPRASALRRHLTERTKAVILNSPNNPTGAVYPERELKRIARFAGANGLLVVSDEIYEPFVFEGKHASIGAYHEDTLTLNGFSKSAGVPGWRIGYAAGPPAVISGMRRLQELTCMRIPAFAQKAMVTSLAESCAQHAERYRMRRNHLWRALSGMYKLMRPRGAFYAFPEAPGGNGDEFALHALDEGVVVVPGSAFSARNTHFRISFSGIDLAAGIEALRRLSAKNVEEPLGRIADNPRHDGETSRNADDKAAEMTPDRGFAANHLYTRKRREVPWRTSGRGR